MESTDLAALHTLERLHGDICQSGLDAVDFSNKMLQAGIINSGALNDIKSKPSSSERIATLLDYIKKCGKKNVLKSVIDDMKKDRSIDWLVDRLHETYREEQALKSGASYGPPQRNQHPKEPEGAPVALTKESASVAPPEQSSRSHAGPALVSSIKKLEDSFFQMVKAIQVDCDHVDIRDIQTSVTLLPQIIRDEYLPFLKEHAQTISKATCAVEIFTTLNMYWDYTNYGILDHLVERCGSRNTKEMMEAFKNEVEDFMKKTKLADFMSVWKGRKNAPPDVKELIVRHELDPEHTTLDKLDEFRRDFCLQYSLSHLALMFKCVTHGSVTVVWMIPSGVVEYLCAEIKNPDIGYKVFKQYSVQEVLIDGAKVFESESGKDDEEEDKINEEESDDSDGDVPEDTLCGSDQSPEYEYVEQPPQEYFCPVTQELLLSPYQSSCCGHQFSKLATTQLEELKKQCPMCRKRKMTFNKDKAFKRKVWSVKIYCPHKKDSVCSCTWSGELSDLKRHLKDHCQSVKVLCPSGCSQEIQRGRISEHKANNCPKRPFTCRYCEKVSTYEEISAHLLQCSTELVPCPNNCGDGSIERQHMQDHIKVCPNELVRCEYSFSGCDHQVMRSQLSQHMKETIEGHLLLLTKYSTERITMLEKKIECLAAGSTSQVRLIPYTTPEFAMFEFSERRKSGKSWFSRPFYTHPGGYKFCLRVEAGGMGEHKGVSLGVSIHLMRGEYDDKLLFPFSGDITVQLVNQNRESADHCTKTFNLTKECGANVVGQVTKEGEFARNDGWAHNQFVLLEDLELNKSLNRQYLKNDCLKFRVLNVDLND